jgi:hypothetical protein
VVSGKDAYEVIASPNDGYIFLQWSDGSTNPKRQDTNVKANKNVRAIFAQESWTIQYTASEGGSISGLANQNIDYGLDARPVTAVPKQGYVFRCWSDGNVSPRRQDKKITNGFSITAEFECLFAGGFGTKEQPFIIESYQHLVYMNQFPTSCFILGIDIDFSEIVHAPLFCQIINDEIKGFEGVFDGNGHEIKNMTVDSYNMAPSLFGVIGEKGTIKNLTVSNATIIIQDYNVYEYFLCVGILASTSSGTLENIKVSGSIMGNGLNHDGVAVGGLTGQSYGTIKNCEAEVQIDISAAKTNNTGMDARFPIGGLVGVCGGDIDASKINGQINISDSDEGILAGGVIGYYFNQQAKTLMTQNCEADVEINSTQTILKSGGFVARIDCMKGLIQIENCSASGDIESIGSSQGAGFVDVCYTATDTLIINNCYSTGDINCRSLGGGFAVYFTGKISNCYSSGKVNVATGAGFIMQALEAIINDCFSNSTVTAVNAAGFAHYFTGVMQRCYFEGVVYANLRGASFIFYTSFYTDSVDERSIMNDCYSTGDVIITNTNTAEGRTLVGGFCYAIRDTRINNVYYTGNVTGSGVITKNSSIGGFCQRIENSIIINARTLKHEDTMAMFVYDNRTPEIEVQIKICEKIEDVY